MLAQLGHEPTALGVAKLYADFTGTFIIDPADRTQAAPIAALGIKVAILPTVMNTRQQKRKVARSLLALYTAQDFIRTDSLADLLVILQAADAYSAFWSMANRIVFSE
jgi:LPPG:FO 2-phospho-L-lactate transferase